ncbi:MAG: hypothetical protein KKB94_09660, partial [Proteobacteria bacterium]|nr:hypothetical protein [Pseudomonadota bacterium]
NDMTNPRGIAPGENGEIINRKNATLDKTKFEEMKKEFYGLRGWDQESGLQTKAKLEALDLKDVAEALERQGLVV